MLRERLAQDELTPQDEEETKAALDEILEFFSTRERNSHGHLKKVLKSDPKRLQTRWYLLKQIKNFLSCSMC